MEVQIVPAALIVLICDNTDVISTLNISSSLANAELQALKFTVSHKSIFFGKKEKQGKEMITLTISDISLLSCGYV